MITVLPESESNVLVLKSIGKLSDSDYKDRMIPKFEAILREHKKVRCLFEMDGKFEGIELSALWDDLHFGMGHPHDFEKVGVVGGPKWIEWAMKIESRLIDCEMRTFKERDREEALVWIKA